MKRLSTLLAALLLSAVSIIGLSGCTSMPTATAPTEAGWETLVGGAHMNEWTVLGNANWRVQRGVLQSELGTGFLVSKKSYKDFQIKAEFWADDDANSGIFIRLSDPKVVTADNSYEVNIFDKRPDPSYGTGAIVNFSKISPMPKAGGKWNVYEITAKGNRITVWLNGVQTADLTDSKFANGSIALQAAGGTIKFSKVWIKPL
jgi:Domain of Unknown Function (DUF1080)